MLRILRGAYSKILRGWCREHLAVDAAGTSSLWPEAEAPVSFSLLGAVKTGCINGYAAQQILCRLAGVVDLQKWNDHPIRTKAQALDLIARAVEESGGRRPRRGGPTVSVRRPQ